MTHGDKENHTQAVDSGKGCCKEGQDKGSGVDMRGV